MPRPKGYRVSQAERERISAGMRRSWAERRPWAEVSGNILAAVNTGDTGRATEILHEYMDERHAASEAEVGFRLTNLSQTERRDMLRDTGEYLDELAAETARLQAQRRTISDADIENIRQTLLALNSRLYLNGDIMRDAVSGARTKTHIPDHLFDPHYSTGWAGCGCGTEGFLARLSCGHEMWSHGKARVGSYISCAACQGQRKVIRSFPKPPEIGPKSSSKIPRRPVARTRPAGYSSPVPKQRTTVPTTKEATMARSKAQVAEPEPEDTEDEDAKDYTVYAGKDATATMADFGEWLLAEVYGDEYPGDADSFLDGVRLGGTLRMEFQRSEFNIERREQRAAEREAERAARPTRARKGKEDAEEAEPEETDEAEETPKSTTRPRRASAAKGSTRPASKSGSGPVAKAKTGARRGRQPAAASGEAPY